MLRTGTTIGKQTQTERIVLKPFDIRATDTGVELWSGYRIQFSGMERHPWQLAAKAELRAALANLEIAEDSAFCGYYDSTDPKPADTENSLFTNLLEAMPRNVRLLRFEQGSSHPPAPPTPIELIDGHLHYYRYAVGGQWVTWEADQILASWSRLPRRLAGDGSARPAWLALREGAASDRVEFCGEQLDPDAGFGVRVTIHTTKSGPRNAITNSESTIDGTIAAFHSDDFSEELLAALTPKLPGITAEELSAALKKSAGPLFGTPAIRANAGFVQISPADERCLIGELQICNDSNGRWPELSGEIFTIRPKNESRAGKVDLMSDSRMDHGASPDRRRCSLHDVELSSSGECPTCSQLIVRVFKDADDAGYRAWIAKHQGGYVINVQKSLNPTDARLHHATCHTINDDPSRGEVFVGDYVKVCGLRLSALEDWAISEWRTSVAKCRHCF